MHWLVLCNDVRLGWCWRKILPFYNSNSNSMTPSLYYNSNSSVHVLYNATLFCLRYTSVGRCGTLWRHIPEIPIIAYLSLPVNASVVPLVIDVRLLCPYRLDAAFLTMVWTLFGIVALETLHIHLRYVEAFGKLLFGLYNWVARILLLNMLIAMMAKSFHMIVVSILFSRG